VFIHRCVSIYNVYGKIVSCRIFLLNPSESHVIVKDAKAAPGFTLQNNVACHNTIIQIIVNVLTCFGSIFCWIV
jgi:hypothetical protein